MIFDGLAEYLMPLATVASSFARLDTQRTMLQDRVRVLGLRLAIERAVRPGDVVVEIGTGTGLLAIFAARAGARKVYAIEMTEMCEVARDAARRNGFGAQIEVIEGRSDEAELPERGDVLISETMGHLGIDEGIVQTVADARRRLLKPQPRLVPKTIDICLVPTADRSVHEREITFWREPLAGVDFSGAARMAAGRVYLRRVFDNEMLAPARVAAHIDLAAAEEPPRCFDTGFLAGRDGEITGLAAWFESELYDGVPLNSRATTSWYPLLFPIDPTLPVTAGGEIIAHLAVRDAGAEAAWSWRISSAGVEREGGRRPVAEA
ncbi:MAG: 50S ribosomal protein L11 methyltransferase [Acidobacteriota bacterium]